MAVEINWNAVKPNWRTFVRLAESAGSSLVGFIQDGTGAVSRTSQAKMREIVSLKDAGALEDGSTDDTAAWNKAIGWLNAGTHRAIMLGGISSVAGALTTITADGVALYAPAPTEDFRIVQNTDAVDTLTFSPSVPASDRIDGIGLHNLTIWSSVNAPTAGAGLKIIRGGRLRASNIDIRNHFKGLVLEGGADQKWTNVTIAGSANWTARAANSAGMIFQVASYGATNEVPSEIFFSECNIKGVDEAGSHWLDYGIIINAADGVWFTSGHVGFAYTNSLSINPSGTSTFIDAVTFTSVYFDGNFGTTGSGVVIASAAAGPITNVDFVNCKVKLHGVHGVQMTGTGTARGIRFEGGFIEQNGQWGALIGAQTDVSFRGVYFYNNNTANAGANCINAVGVTNLKIQGCTIKGGTFTHSQGVNIDTTSSNVLVEDNHFGGCTTNMALNSPSCNYKGNQIIGSFPTATAAAALSLPFGFDSVEVTGNTNLTSISGANVKGHRVLLRFTGTPTVTRGGNLGLTTGGGNMVCTAGSVLQLENDGTVWREISRAVA